MKTQNQSPSENNKVLACVLAIIFAVGAVWLAMLLNKPKPPLPPSDVVVVNPLPNAPVVSYALPTVQMAWEKGREEGFASYTAFCVNSKSTSWQDILSRNQNYINLLELLPRGTEGFFTCGVDYRYRDHSVEPGERKHVYCNGITCKQIK